VRPVNLIPLEERRGDATPLRKGPLAYVVVALLAVALVVVTVVVMTTNQITEKQAQVASLEQREQQATARAQALQPYAEFANLAENRAVTVESLARSRFDWERVLNELALVLPSNVWLVSLNGTVAPGVQSTSGVSVSSRATIAGPALEIAGCATSQDAVAGFLSALRDIDGVTRVGLESSARPESGASSGGSEGGGQSGDTCQTRDFITEFQIVAAFDEVTVAPVATPPATPSTVPPAGAATESADASQVADGQEQEAQPSAGAQTEKSEQAVNIIPGVAK
jgi:Tfp pilus assembly protein PilN